MDRQALVDLIRKNESRLKDLTPDQRKQVVTALAKKMEGGQEPVSPPAAFDVEAESTRARDMYLPEGIGNMPPEVVGRDFHERTKQAVGELDRRRNTATSGVELNTPLPAGNAKIGFSDNPAVAIQNSLTDHYREKGVLGQDQQVNTRMGPTSGELEWQDPETGTFHIANPDALSKAGLAIPVVGDVAGTLAGGAAGLALGRGPAGMVAGETFGSYGGTRAGETIRLAIGKLMGANDLDWSEINDKAADQGMKAGAMTLVTGGGIAGFKGLQNFVRGRIWTKKAAMEHGLTSQEADVALDEVNRILKEGGSDAQVKSTLAKRTGDPSLGSTEAQLRRESGYADRFLSRDSADTAATTEAFDIAGQRFNRAPSADPGGNANAVQDALGGQVERRLGQAKEIVAANKKELETTLNQFPRVTPESVGGQARKALEDMRDAVEKSVDNAHDEWRKMTNYDPETRTTGIKLSLDDEVLALKSAFSRESNNAITEITKKSKSRIFGNIEEDEAAQKAEIYLSRWIGEPPGKTGAAAKQLDLADFNIALSDLKRSVRTASKNGQITDPAIGDMKKVIQALEENRNKALDEAGLSELKGKILAAERKTREFYETYERSMVGNLVAKDELGYKVSNEHIFRTVFNGGEDGAKHVTTVIGDNPQAMQAWRKAIMGEYERSVMKDGVPNKAKHELFIESHRGVLETFFSKDQMRQVERLGGLGEVVTKQSKQLDNLIKKAQKDWGRGKISSLDPHNLVKFVRGESGGFYKPNRGEVKSALAKTLYVKNMLRNHPQAWRSYQDASRRELQNSVFKNGKIDHKALNNILDNQRDDLIETFDAKYFHDLKAIAKVAEINARSGKVLSGDEFNKALIQSVRGTELAPPLSQRGRQFSAFLLFKNKAAHDMIADALLDPEKLHKVARLAQHNAANRRALELASSLGFAVPELETEPVNE